MKILLVNNNVHPYLNLAQRVSFSERFFPLGLFNIALYLKNMGYAVKVLDAFASNLDVSRVRDVICEYRPDIVGIANCYYSAIDGVFRISSACKQVDKDIVTIVGGVLPSYVSRDLLARCPSIDYIIRGEGEQVLYRLVEALRNKTSLTDICRLAYRGPDGTIHSNDGRYELDTFHVDPAEIPDVFIARYRNHYISPRMVMSIEASRGCRYACHFCTIRNFLGEGVRYKKPVEVVDEIDGYVRHFQLKRFRFIDNTFTENKEFVYSIVEEIKKRGLHKKIKWGALTRISCIEPALLKSLRSANCFALSLGVESYSQETLDGYKKGISLEQIQESFALMKEHGIKTKAFFVLNQYAFRTSEEIEDEIDKVCCFLKSLRPDSLGFVPLLLYPETPLFDKYVQDGTIEINGRRSLLEGRLIPSRYIPEKTVFDAVLAVYKRYTVGKYLRKARELPRTVFMGGH